MTKRGARDRGAFGVADDGVCVAVVAERVIIGRHDDHDAGFGACRGCIGGRDGCVSRWHRRVGRRRLGRYQRQIVIIDIVSRVVSPQIDGGDVQCTPGSTA